MDIQKEVIYIERRNVPNDPIDWVGTDVRRLGSFFRNRKKSMRRRTMMPPATAPTTAPTGVDLLVVAFRETPAVDEDVEVVV
jgi:hypothetical protein